MKAGRQAVLQAAPAGGRSSIGRVGKGKLTYGSIVGAIFVLVGLAAALNDDLRSKFLSYVALAGVAALAAVGIGLAIVRVATPRIKRAVQGYIATEVRGAMGAERDTIRGWIREDVAEVRAQQRESEARTKKTIDQWAARMAKQEAENAKVRGSINQLIEELDYLVKKVDEDNPAFWRQLLLPKRQWVAHASLLAAKDGAAHAAVSKVYDEADRINRCVRRADMRRASIRPCEPEKLTAAATAAKVELDRVLETVKEPQWAKKPKP
jgi:hypothetical protein